MSLYRNKVFEVLTQADSFPYTPSQKVYGVDIANDGNDTVTVVINDNTIASPNNITINCTTSNRTFSGDFREVAQINVTAGTTNQISLRYL